MDVRLTLPATCLRDDGRFGMRHHSAAGLLPPRRGGALTDRQISPKRDTTLFLRWVESVAEGVETTL